MVGIRVTTRSCLDLDLVLVCALDHAREVYGILGPHNGYWADLDVEVVGLDPFQLVPWVLRIADKACPTNGNGVEARIQSRMGLTHAGQRLGNRGKATEGRWATRDAGKDAGSMLFGNTTSMQERGWRRT